MEWGSARWPDGPPHGEVAHGFGMIPVTVAGESVHVGGSVEQREEKLGPPRSDMASDEMLLESARSMTRLNTVHKHLEPHTRMCK